MNPTFLWKKIPLVATSDNAFNPVSCAWMDHGSGYQWDKVANGNLVNKQTGKSVWEIHFKSKTPRAINVRNAVQLSLASPVQSLLPLQVQLV